MIKNASKLIIAVAALVISLSASAENLVIIHTNDTHSQIDPDRNDRGGVARRKALVDSIRGAEENFLLIDAGDAVQGSLYFTLYKGDVECKVMNALGYDLAIVGNHDFDNGLESLAWFLEGNKAKYLSANYDVEGTPIEGMFTPYVIKEFGGKRIAFMGLNLDPNGMISARNYTGMKFNSVYDTANALAAKLKQDEKVDMVVAITHIGYDDDMLENDLGLARGSRDIDVIIGGHSHTLINPADPMGHASRVPNLDGKEVVIAQLDKGGVHVGRIDIDLDNLTASSQVLDIDSRYDDRIDPALMAEIMPYKSRIDSLLSIDVAQAATELSKQQLTNLFADMLRFRAKDLSQRNIDFSILNNGGVRTTVAEGKVAKGDIMMVLPFNNYITVLEVSGKDLLEAFDVMANRGINGVSDNVRVVYDPQTLKCVSVMVDGQPLDPEATYVVGTIDYLADGGDYLSSLTRGKKIYVSESVLYDDICESLRLLGTPLSPAEKPRFSPLDRD